MSNKVPCPLCQRDMASPKTVSCLRRKAIEFEDGSIYAAIPYAHDPDYPDLNVTTDRCRDCGVAWYGTHHPNCCIETCPKCYGQALSCDDCQPVTLLEISPTEWKMYRQRQRAINTERMFQELQGMGTHFVDGDVNRTAIDHLLLVHPRDRV